VQAERAAWPRLREQEQEQEPAQVVRVAQAAWTPRPGPEQEPGLVAWWLLQEPEPVLEWELELEREPAESQLSQEREPGLMPEPEPEPE
jgi:hypothetical protein